MKKLFFILIFLIFFPSLTFAAGKDDVCLRYKTMPELVFSTSYGKLVYNRSRNQQQLTAIGKQFGIVEQGLFASGLALVGVNYHVSVNTASRVAADGGICVIPVRVELFIGYQNPIIYISKELEEGSCEYNVVLRHEQTHQQINTAALEYFIPRLKSAALSVLNNVPPQRIDNSGQIDAATRQFVHTYSAQLEPLINFFKAELLREQSKLDNHENYQLEGSLCRYYNQNHRR